MKSMASVGMVVLIALLACKKGGDSDPPGASKPAPKGGDAVKVEEPPTVKQCPASWLEAEKTLSAAGELECQCEASGINGSVWGSGIYTADSSICHAALHAGAVPSTGGTIKAKRAAACASYKGSTAHGVTSSDWGAYEEGSFYFPAHGDGTCAALSAACPATFNEISGHGRETNLTCHCAPAAMAGSVWGTDIYTADSSICAAARHAGAVPAEGGAVTLRGAFGCASYSGMHRNGVTSGRWGSYEMSFFFDGHGSGTCK